MRRYRLRLHPLVRYDTADIRQYVGDFAGEETGRRKLREIARSIRTLSERPHQGTKRDEILPGLRAIPSAEKGVIAFRVDDDREEVHVLCISYAGQDWRRDARRRSETMP